MKSRFILILALTAVVGPSILGQPMRRWAVIAAHGPAANSNQGIAQAEARLTDDVTTQLTGVPGVTLIDRASVDRILKEQNFQNSDRSSAETAARIGKLLGVGQIVMVQVSDATYSMHNEQARFKTKTFGTVVLRARARIIDVETGIIQAQPSSAFEESVLISEKSNSQSPIIFGGIRIPQGQSAGGGDPKVVQNDEWAKASDTVAKDLATKLTSSMPAPSVPKMEPPLVAGIASGAVYINRGSTVGIKAGDRFQVTRQVSLGFNDPATGQPMLKKQRVCVLTIVSADESSSSGTCQGGLPQPKDVAEPLSQ
jgi:copper chaperone CopZ